MSSLWTPEGEHPVGPRRPDTQAGGPTPGTPPGAAASGSGVAAPDGEQTPEDQEQLAAHLEELRRQLISTPAEVVVANHAYGLFELAAIHLSQQPPRLEEARLAIDAMANIVEGLSGRLGEPERSLKEALSQIRIAFVEIGGSTRDDGASSSPGR